MSVSVRVCVLNAAFWKVAVYLVCPLVSQVAVFTTVDVVFTVSVST